MGIKSVRFPDELVEAIRVEAERSDRSFNWVVVNAVRSELSREGGSLLESQARAVKAIERDPSLAEDLRFGPKVDQAVVVESVEASFPSKPSSRPGQCPECERFNGVHAKTCSRHPRNA